ncbi:DNA polymerase III subunit beta [Roseomonas indoligenes]|uniref:Beta sliding clamp n=1 Tax=Roseomonas indoligenes TaxID=2820811 RepID=A0A940S3D3_9PROT|nr:DNA polymerase III subunit beta [Pararoseomonas indoligenes]MBP0492116.1 DNA polymerase III subunit beta [Pararoseomonas indoligenes]
MPDGSIHAEGMAPGEVHASSPPPRGARVLAGHLRAAVRAAAAVTERRNTIPILANLLLRSERGTLTVRGTDMEMCITATAPGVGDLAQVTAPALTLAALLARLPEAVEVDLEPEPDLGALLVKAPGLRARLIALPAADWPRMVEAKMTAKFAIPVASLRRLVTLPAHAISTEETRYYLNGIFLERNLDAGGPWLTAVATDGHRLMKVDEPLPQGAETLPGIIVPRKAVTRLRAALEARATGDVQVEASDTRMVFRVGTLTIETKLIDGTFPDYRRVIPREAVATGKMIIHQPRAFREAVETAAAISTERSRPVKFSGMKGSIVITAASPDFGSAQVDLPEDVASWEGRDREIGFQCRYLAALAKILPEGFTASIEDGSAPMRIDFPRGIAVLMPMRV